MDRDLKRFGFPSRGGMEEDDGAVELSLGLSIGRSGKKAPRSGAGAAAVHQIWEHCTGSGEAVANRVRSGTSMPAFSSQPPPLPAFLQGEIADGHDPQRRREMHALRRQEARKKRHEKQQKKGSACGGRDCPAAGFYGCSAPEGACSLDDRAALEAQEQRQRARDREAREEEALHCNPTSGDNHEVPSDSVPYTELNANHNAGANPNPDITPNLAPFGVHPLPMMAMQYAYPHVQYVPTANGFGFPYMMPCWASPMPSFAGVPNPPANIFQPVACRALQPLSDADWTNGASPLGSKAAEKGTEIKRAPSWNGSLGSGCSSAISDHQSNSLQGGSSTSSGDAPANSSNPRQLSPQVSNVVQGQSDHSFSSRQIEPEVDAVEAPKEKRPSPITTQSGTKGGPHPAQCSPAKLEGVVSGANKPIPAADEPVLPPARPSSPMPRMPCVSTTGNGPNGTTITGFLYRYTSTEVSIVCVCHGMSFSPAEFVKHAGGTEIANPLKHITIVPS